MRIIPKKSRVSFQIFRGVTLFDMIFATVYLLLLIVTFRSNIGFAKWILASIETIAFGFLVMKVQYRKGYQLLGSLFAFLVINKKYHKKTKKNRQKMDLIMPISAIKNNTLVTKNGYRGAIIQIEGFDFFKQTFKQQNKEIDIFANAIKGITDGAIVKLETAIDFEEFIADNHIEEEVVEEVLEQIKAPKPARKKNRRDRLKEERERARTVNLEASEPEIIIPAGKSVAEKVREQHIRITKEFFEKLNRDQKIYKPTYYLVVYEKQDRTLEDVTETIEDQLQSIGLNTKRLNKKELALFLRNFYNKDFDKNEIDNIDEKKYLNWATPNEIKVHSTKIVVDENEYGVFSIRDYPIEVTNGWGIGLMNIPGTKVVMKIKKIDPYKAIRTIDKDMIELNSQYSMARRESERKKLETQYATSEELLERLVNGNELMYETDFMICTELSGVGASSEKEIKRKIRDVGFKLTNFSFNMLDGYVSMIPSPIMLKPVKIGYAINSSSLSAVFPFVSEILMDKKGKYIGYNDEGIPVIFDLFKRDKSRVNSSAVILGKSGQGKSYFSKAFLSKLACDNTKIIAIDPENEYSYLCKTHNGTEIDVSGSKKQLINPFQIFPPLEEDNETENGTALPKTLENDLTAFLGEEVVADLKKKKIESVENSQNPLTLTLQFLNQFFRIILPDIELDTACLLDNLVLKLYNQKGITNKTNFKTLKAKDFPIFDDLYNLIKEEMKKTKEVYAKENLSKLENYIGRFAGEGLNSSLWNGYTTLEIDNDFSVFNFRELLSNKNQNIANAQMLLVIRFLEQEIIKNREYNLKTGDNKRILILIDEAHCFIDEKFPIALDFMYQMAKRIRKYNGSLITTTQNIKDFIGRSPEVQAKASALINNCQYKIVFHLAEDDLNDLINLFRNGVGLTEDEQEYISQAGLGQALFFIDTYQRVGVNIKIIPGEELFVKDA